MGKLVEIRLLYTVSYFLRSTTFTNSYDFFGVLIKKVLVRFRKSRIL